MLLAPSQLPARSIHAFRKGVARKELALLGTRVQFRQPLLNDTARGAATRVGFYGLRETQPLSKTVECVAVATIARCDVG
jgi:hypothetical protein